MAKSGAVKAGRAFVELFADRSKLVRGLRAAAADLKAFGAKVRTLGLAMAGIGTALLVPLVAASKYFSSYGDQVAKMAKRTGLSVETLSELRHVAKQTGTEFESLENGFRRMQRSIYDAGRDLSTATEALADLQLTFAELDGLSPEDQFKILGDRIGKLEDPTKRAAIAMTLFGRSGTNLLPMFADGAAGIEKLQQEARALGLTMSGKDAAAAESFTDAMERLWKVVQMGVFQIGAALGPLLEDLADRVTGVVVRVVKWIRENRGLIASVFKIAAGVAAAGLALAALGTLISGLGSLLGLAAAAAVTFGHVLAAALAVIPALLSPLGLLLGAIVGLGAYLVWASGVGGKAIDWLAGKFGELADIGIRSLQAIGQALAGGNIALAMHVLWASLKVAWEQGTLDLRKKFIDFRMGLEAAWEILKTNVTAIWMRLMTALKGAWIAFRGWHEQQINRWSGWIAKRMIEAQGLVDKTLDVTEAKRQIDIRVAADRSANEQETDRQQQENRALHAAAMALLAQQHRENLANIGQEAEARIEAAESALRKARAAWEKSLADVGIDRPATGEPPPPGAPPRIEDVLEALESVRHIETLGGVSAAAFSRVGYGSTIEARQLDTLKSIDEGVARLNRAAEQSEGMAFS